MKYLNAAATAFFHQGDQTLAQDGTVVNNTGNVTENTTRSKLIPAGMLGANGALIVEWALGVVAQGGVATTFRIRLGAVQLVTFGQANINGVQIRMVLQNRNSQAAQSNFAWKLDTGSVIQDGASNTAVDTSVDQTLSLTIQNGATTDNWNDQGWKVHGAVSRLTPL